MQNRYNLARPRVPKTCSTPASSTGSRFIPWFPLATGALAEPGGALGPIAAAHDATPGQVALAWLLARSPVVLPIPGTGSVAHLEENLGARTLQLSGEELGSLAQA